MAARGTQLNVLLYGNITLLDAFGPVDVLCRLDGVQARCYSLAGDMAAAGQGIQVATQGLAGMETAACSFCPGASAHESCLATAPSSRRCSLPAHARPTCSPSARARPC